MSTDRELDPKADVLNLAERLVDRLRHGGTAGALTVIDDLRRAFPALEEALRETRQEEMHAAVAAAVGAALTHEWVVSSGIDCARCQLHTVDHVLRIGALPECGAGAPCASFAAGHLVLLTLDDDPTARQCTYCKTVFPATAGTREGVTTP